MLASASLVILPALIGLASQLPVTFITVLMGLRFARNLVMCIIALIKCDKSDVADVVRALMRKPKSHN